MPSVTSHSWQDAASRAQAGVYDTIPAKWRLSPAQLKLAEDANVMNVPLTCGILTPEQLAITEQTATELLTKLASGKLTSVDVTEAFCARAAIAHQLVRQSSPYNGRKMLTMRARRTVSWNSSLRKPCVQLHHWTNT